MELERRRFLGSLVAGGAGLLVAAPAAASIPGQIEHHRLAVDHPDLHGRRLVHLTDLHLSDEQSERRIRQALRIVNRLRPDLVLLTGDYVNWGTTHIEPLAELLSYLRAPRVAILGNHDHYAGGDLMTAALEARGTRVLRNASAVLPIGAARLRLIGIDDRRTGHEDVAAAVAGVGDDEELCLALVHNPAAADDLPPGLAHLILAGHTHGGQIDIRGLTRWVVRMVGSGYVRGFYDTPGGRLYVNRGWGTVGMPMRVGAAAEIAVFHLDYTPGRGLPRGGRTTRTSSASAPSRVDTAAVTRHRRG